MMKLYVWRDIAYDLAVDSRIWLDIACDLAMMFNGITWHHTLSGYGFQGMTWNIPWSLYGFHGMTCNIPWSCYGLQGITSYHVWCCYGFVHQKTHKVICSTPLGSTSVKYVSNSDNWKANQNVCQYILLVTDNVISMPKNWILLTMINMASDI
jgi:hypothetical protein